mmetsp:Transcript_6464/g.13252  ORF Transcript_6464/g.13252 Transcript_6464/m.13252 type:complete len:235 (+) Transcript_6464:492-1196(+)
MESWRMPAEWMKPAMFGVFTLMYSSTPSCLLQSHLACETSIPSSAASLSISFQFGMFWSLIFMDRDRNSMEKRLPPCSLALFRIHRPMTSPSAPFPPEIPITPSSGSWKSGLFSYSSLGTWRRTYRPLFRMRTVLWPKDWWRKISAAMYLVFSVLSAHSVSMYWMGHWTSCRAVLLMPKSVQLVMRPRPHSSWISRSSAKVSTVSTQRRLQRVASSPIFFRIVRYSCTTAFWCL